MCLRDFINDLDVMLANAGVGMVHNLSVPIISFSTMLLEFNMQVEAGKRKRIAEKTPQSYWLNYGVKK